MNAQNVAGETVTKSDEDREKVPDDGVVNSEDTRENSGNKKYLQCELGNEVFGIDISYVTDIIELQKITAVPDMPRYVKGVINLRGKVIPVVDLRLRFGMSERAYDDRTVITVVNVAETTIGFIVDTATEVQDIPANRIEPTPRFQNTEGKKNFIAGLGKINDEVTIILDIETLVSGETTGEMSDMQTEATSTELTD